MIGLTYLEIIVLIACWIGIVGMFWAVKRMDKKKRDDRISEAYRNSHLEGKFPGKNYGD